MHYINFLSKQGPGHRLKLLIKVGYLLLAHI